MQSPRGSPPPSWWHAPPYLPALVRRTLETLSIGGVLGEFPVIGGGLWRMRQYLKIAVTAICLGTLSACGFGATH